MTRKDYIAGLEEIRKRVKEIEKAFGTVDLTDATNMESDRHKKTRKIVADLCDRLYEDIAISAKVAADNAEAGIGEQGDLFDAAAKAEEATSDAPRNATLALPAPSQEPTTTDEPKKPGKGKGKKRGKKGGAK